MTEIERNEMHFNLIDDAINDFVTDKDLYITSYAHSDWLTFDWRQITWNKESLSYLIEIYPNFDDLEKITSWNFYAAVFYDDQDTRQWLPKDFGSEVSLEFISENIKSLLECAYDYISSIKKENIPKG